MIGSGDAKGAFASSVDRPGRGTDFGLILAAAVLLLFGLLCMHSIDMGRTGTNYLVRQLVWAAIGTVVFLVCAAVRPATLQRLSKVLYVAMLGSLAAVLVFGDTKKGSTRWIDLGPIQFQPSEVAKVLLIVTLATYFVKRAGEEKSLRTYLGSLAHVLPPIGLVLLQPHLAGAMSLIMIWLAVSLYAGVPGRFIAVTALAITGLLAFAWYTPGVMPSYMKDRVLGKFGPTANVKDNAYQQDRAKIALGVGGVTGLGYGRGEQKAARYIPEQQNDFVFTVVGEELGLVGGLLLIGAFGFFFFRVWLVGYRASDPFGQLLSAGVLAVLGFHTLVNLGMNIGITPVAGLWLPFVSYGGTALWMCMACVGLLANVK